MIAIPSPSGRTDVSSPSLCVSSNSISASVCGSCGSGVPRRSGFDDVAVLQHVVGDQYAVLIKDTQDFRQEVDVLSLSGVHKNGTAVQGFYTLARTPGISVMRLAKSIFRSSPVPLGCVFRNFHCGNLASGSPYCAMKQQTINDILTSRILFGCFIFKNTFKKLCISRRMIGTFVCLAVRSRFSIKWGVAGVQGIDVGYHSFVYYHVRFLLFCKRALFRGRLSFRC